MRVVCVWREGYDYSRTVEEWIHEFERRTGKEIESLDPDTCEGESFCRSYGVMQYPAIFALGEDGAVLADWRGEMLPLFDEVAYWI